MVKHTKAIRWQQPTNCLSVFDHFVELAPKGLSETKCSRMNQVKIFKGCLPHMLLGPDLNTLSQMSVR